MALVHVHARPDLRRYLRTHMRVDTAVRGVHLDAPGVVELQHMARRRLHASAAGPPHARDQQEGDDDAHQCRYADVRGCAWPPWRNSAHLTLDCTSQVLAATMGGYLKPYGGQRKVGQRPRGGIFFNGIVWRFIPGMVAGYMLNTFFAGRETVSGWCWHGWMCGCACVCLECALQALARLPTELLMLSGRAAQRAAKKGDPASGGGKAPIKIVDITEESKLKMVRRATSLSLAQLG